MVSTHKVVGDVAEAGLLRMIGTIAVILPAVALVQVLANAHDYRQPAAVIAVWLAVLGAAAWLAPRMRARVLSAAETAAAIAIAIAAVTVVGAERSGRVMPGSVDLAVLGTLGLLVVVALSAPAWVSAPAALTVYAVHSALLIRAEGMNSLTLSELEAAGLYLRGVSDRGRRAAPDHSRPPQSGRPPGVAGEQVGGGKRRRHGDRAGAAEPAGGAGEGGASAVARHRRRNAGLDRRRRQGTVRPARRRAPARPHPRRAGRWRSHERARGGAGDRPRARAAGDRPAGRRPGTGPARLARAVLATVDAVLRSLPPQPVTLTVLGVGDDVELYLAFDTPSPNGPDLPGWQGNDLPAAARWRATMNAAEPGGGYLEISWRKDGAA